MVYTEGSDFEWDDANVEHIARHGVTPSEAEEAFSDDKRRLFRTRSPAEIRHVVLGRTEVGRLLMVIFTRRDNRIRVVTARAASDAERRRYEG